MTMWVYLYEIFRIEGIYKESSNLYFHWKIILFYKENGYLSAKICRIFKKFSNLYAIFSLLQNSLRFHENYLFNYLMNKRQNIFFYLHI